MKKELFKAIFRLIGSILALAGTIIVGWYIIELLLKNL